MTRDLDRFSSSGQLERWRPGRNLVCLQDAAGSLLGVVWVAEKPLPSRDDYFDPELIRCRGPRLTFAVRTYGPARGHGLARSFCEYALGRLMRDRADPYSLWYQTKAANAAARRLCKSLGFFEASGEESGTVIGIRLASPPRRSADSPCP
jgi:GNAT superfamily N-acetyltransferase